MATTQKSTARKTTAKKTGATKTGTRRATPKAATTKTAPATATTATAERSVRPLGEIDVKTVVTDSAYAGVGAGDAAIATARELPQRLEALRTVRAEELIKANREKAEAFLKDVPTRAQAVVKDVPGSARTLAETSRKEFDAYAARGRKVVETIAEAPATKRAISQTDTARTQVKGAVTSIRKAVEQSQAALEGAVDKIGVRRKA